MSKESEAFKEILDTLSKALKLLNGSEVNMNSRRVKLVEQGLQRLEAIENAEPSEAIRELKTFSYIMTRCKDEDSYIIKFPLGIEKGTTFGEDMEKAYKVIKQALLKAQEDKIIADFIREHYKLSNDINKNYLELKKPITTEEHNKFKEGLK